MPPEEILAENTALKREVSELKTDLKLAELKIRDLNRRLYGKKTERRLPSEDGQESLGIEEPEVVVEQQAKEDPVKTVSRPPRRPRHPLPDKLERLESRLEPEKKSCPQCGRELSVIGEEVTEELDLIPARFVVRRIVRPKMACTCGCAGVVIAPLPARPVDKGNASAGLLTQVVLAKYVDHLPLYAGSGIKRPMPAAGLCRVLGAPPTEWLPIYPA